MSLNLNRVMLAGNLTRDPEVRFLPNDKAVAKFGLAINRRFKDANGQQKDDTTFVDVETWGRTAELVGQYLTKGRGCCIEGRLKMENWGDKTTGQKRSKLIVVADAVHFTDAKSEGAAGHRDDSTSDIATAPLRPAPSAGADDEAPF
jgi:single-strand DNA-binding protein